MPHPDENVKRATAEERGFKGYNSGPHLCVDVPDGHFTITCINSEGKKVTFAFCPNAGPQAINPGHQCIDIQGDLGVKNEDGTPIQQGTFLGQGPTNAVCKYTDPEPTTLFVLSLRKPD